jgi:hypothetical protein
MDSSDMSRPVTNTTSGAAPPERRRLRFETIDEALSEADRLATADRDGRLDRAGTWTLGQTLGHLATWADFAFDGYPESIRAPLPIRLILRVARGRILSKGMTPGVRIRGIPGGTLGLEPLDAGEGLRRYRAALERFRHASPTRANPIFGPLTPDQWIQLNLRHAELHLSFLLPR